MRTHSPSQPQQHLRRLAAALGVIVIASSLPARAQTTVPVCATEDVFVMSPGPGNSASYWDGAERNFGYMRSRHVAAATAHPGDDPTAPCKGEFQAVARFYPSNAVAQLDAQYGPGKWRISGLALMLMTSDNVAGPGIFNAPGNAGQYNVCWMPADGRWVQGNGYINQDSSSHDPVAHPENFTGLTYDGLESIVSTNPAVVLNTLNFVKQGILAPVTNSLTLTNQPFLDALVNARPTSLLFQAADNHVAFNFTSHLYGDDRETNLYSATLFLSATPLPALAPQLESVGNSTYLTVRFQRPAGATNLLYLLETTADLSKGPWTLVASSTNGAPMSGPGLVAEIDSGIPGLKEDCVRDLTPAPAATCRFLRLRILK